jgi:hypothetical protein
VVWFFILVFTLLRGVVAAVNAPSWRDVVERWEE